MKTSKTSLLQIAPALALLAIGLSACGHSRLTCNDEAVKKKVLDLIHSHIEELSWFNKAKPYLGKRYLSDISTMEANKELARYTCQAVYSFEYKNKTQKVEITYNLRYLEDKKETQVSMDIQPVVSRYNYTVIRFGF